jgi:GNAT superfamily N-acetyltransferase
MVIIIRKATTADAQDIFDVRFAAIRDQCKNYYPESALDAWTSGSPSERFRADVEQRFYVATVNNAVIGTGMLDLDSGQLDAIFVHPLYLRQGVGRAIVSFLENIARINSVNRLKLESTLNAATFYRNLGFRGAQISKYVTSQGLELECIPMEKEVPGAATAA